MPSLPAIFKLFINHASRSTGINENSISEKFLGKTASKKSFRSGKKIINNYRARAKKCRLPAHKKLLTRVTIIQSRVSMLNIQSIIVDAKGMLRTLTSHSEIVDEELQLFKAISIREEIEGDEDKSFMVCLQKMQIKFF